MSLKRFAQVFAIATAATLWLGGRAHATYTITPLTINSPSQPTSDLTFVFNTLLNAPMPTPGLDGQSYNYLSVTVTPGASNVTNRVVPYDIVYQATDNTTLDTATFQVKGSLLLNLDTSGSGSLTNTPTPGFPSPSFLLGTTEFHISPIPPNFSSPTLLNGSGGTALFQLNLNTIPEPSSILVMSLGLGLGGLMLRRRMAVKPA
jgi:hypothetical protein